MSNMQDAPKDKLILLWVPEFGLFMESWWPGMWSFTGNCWQLKTPFMLGLKQVFATEFPEPIEWMPMPGSPNEQIETTPEEEKIKNLSMLVRMLIVKVDKTNPDAKIIKQATDYLQKNGLEGSVLRED